jgi:hypothetical protein
MKFVASANIHCIHQHPKDMFMHKFFTRWKCNLEVIAPHTSPRAFDTWTMMYAMFNNESNQTFNESILCMSHVNVFHSIRTYGKIAFVYLSCIDQIFFPHIWLNFLALQVHGEFIQQMFLHHGMPWPTL